MAFDWNPWHGCHKVSEGCRYCYMYRSDARRGVDSSIVTKNKSFDLPVRRGRDHCYKVPPGSLVWTCFTSDFFLEDADEWRREAWEMIRIRRDVTFFMITKRVDRIAANLPSDWGDGYDNVEIACTVENQQMADYRLPIFRTLPIKHKEIIAAPLLEALDLRAYLGPWVTEVCVTGESGPEARVCDYDWILDIRSQCLAAGVDFVFRQTGARLRKDGKVYWIPKRLQHKQAYRAGLNVRKSRKKTPQRQIEYEQIKLF